MNKSKEHNYYEFTYTDKEGVVRDIDTDKIFGYFIPPIEERESDGCYGFCGPNDGGYINSRIRQAAYNLQHAMILYCEGHYPHSNARDIPENDPIRDALSALAEWDKRTAKDANTIHDPRLFKVYEPTEKAKHRWDSVK